MGGASPSHEHRCVRIRVRCSGHTFAVVSAAYGVPGNLAFTRYRPIGDAFVWASSCSASFPLDVSSDAGPGGGLGQVGCFLQGVIAREVHGLQQHDRIQRFALSEVERQNRRPLREQRGVGAVVVIRR